MHVIIVQREVILPKWHLEVLDAVQTTAIASHYCFLLLEHLAESTNRCYNSGAGARTTLAYLQTELNIMETLERCVALQALLRHPTTGM